MWGVFQVTSSSNNIGAPTKAWGAIGKKTSSKQKGGHMVNPMEAEVARAKVMVSKRVKQGTKRKAKSKKPPSKKSKKKANSTTSKKLMPPGVPWNQF